MISWRSSFYFGVPSGTVNIILPEHIVPQGHFILVVFLTDHIELTNHIDFFFFVNFYRDPERYRNSLLILDLRVIFWQLLFVLTVSNQWHLNSTGHWQFVFKRLLTSTECWICVRIHPITDTRSGVGHLEGIVIAQFILWKKAINRNKETARILKKESGYRYYFK